METQKTSNSQRSLEKKNGTDRINLPDFKLQSYSQQASLVPAQKQKYRPMEYDRKPRDKHTYLWALYF